MAASCGVTLPGARTQQYYACCDPTLSRRQAWMSVLAKSSRDLCRAAAKALQYVRPASRTRPAVGCLVGTAKGLALVVARPVGVWRELGREEAGFLRERRGGDVCATAMRQPCLGLGSCKAANCAGRAPGARASLDPQSHSTNTNTTQSHRPHARFSPAASAWCLFDSVNHGHASPPVLLLPPALGRRLVFAAGFDARLCPGHGAQDTQAHLWRDCSRWDPRF